MYLQSENETQYESNEESDCRSDSLPEDLDHDRLIPLRFDDIQFLQA